MKVSLRFSSLIVLTAATLPWLAQAQIAPQLTPLTTFGINSDGSIRPGDSTPSDVTGSHALFDVLFNQRGIAYDPVSKGIVVVDAHAGTGGSADVRGGIYILDGTNGNNFLDSFSFPLTLNTNGMTNFVNSGYVDAAVGVADDGAVYVCNHVNNSVVQAFRIYRWESVMDTNPPYLCFSNNILPAQRYGGNLDIRGAGTNTEIIVGSRANGTTGTNVVIFKTVDGTNFYSVMLGTDVTTPDFDHGVAFGHTNTFWAKHIGGSLRLLRYNLASSNAITLRAFTSAQIQGVENLGPLAVDTNLNLLAAIEEAGGTDTGGPERVRLFDISNIGDVTKNPLLLDIKAFTPDLPNAAAPPGFLDFGGGNLYAHVINNGMIAWSVGSVAVPPPVIVDQPAATNRVARGQTLTLVVSAYPLVSYQWRSNGVAIPNATNASYTLANIQTNFVANYTCTVTNSAGSTNTANSYLEILNPADLLHLEMLWAVGTNDAPFLDFGGSSGTPNQRTLAYSTLKKRWDVVTRGGVPTTAFDSTSSNYFIHVINATNGVVLHTLDTTGIQNWVFSTTPTTFGIALCGIGVAADGAVYACTEAPNAYGNGGDPNYTFKVYRWADDDPGTLPVKIFEGEPSTDSITNRWGDIMVVRGAGTNTQLLVDVNAAPAASPGYRKAAIIYPDDQNMTNFSSVFFLVTAGSGNSIGRGLQFDGNNNSIWQKRKGAQLIKTQFDPNSSPGPRLIDATTVASYSSFPATLQGVAIDGTGKYAAGCDTPTSAALPETLNVFYIDNPNSPVMVGSYNFKPRPNPGNANGISQTIIADNMLFALAANNGIMACRMLTGNLPAPTFVTQPQGLRLVAGNAGSMSVQTFESCTFQWQKFSGVGFTNIPNQTNATYTIASATAADGGDYRVVATSSFAGSANSSVATVIVTGPQDNYSLAPLWTLAPGSRPYLIPDTSLTGATPLYRGIAYNGLSNQVYVISRTNATSGLAVNVLDADTGADLYQLNTNGISDGSIVLASIAVAGDGSIYAANLDTSVGTTSNATYKLYRWTNAAPSTPPVLVYSGEPANQAVPVRWGDTMDVRGSGTNTEIVIDGLQTTNPTVRPSFAAVLRPIDGTLNSFTNAPVVEPGGNTPLGRSLQFGSGATIWQKRSRGALVLRSYDLDAQTVTFVESYSKLPTSVGPVALDFSRNLLASVDISHVTNGPPDTVSLYEISDLYNPQLIAKYNFPSNSQPNVNLLGQVIFAGNRVWAVDGNNGILAFNINGPRLNVASSGSNVLISWGLFSGYTLQATPSIASPITWTNVGPGTIVNGQYVVTNTPSGPALFYRLIR